MRNELDFNTILMVIAIGVILFLGQTMLNLLIRISKMEALLEDCNCVEALRLGGVEVRAPYTLNKSVLQMLNFTFNQTNETT